MEIRGVEFGHDVVSPPAHTAFTTPTELLQFLKRLRDASGGKPVGFKLCVGKRHEFLGIVKAMLATGITPDFITVDGGEGGTGAAPLEFSDSVGTPLNEGLSFVHNALVGADLRDRIRVIASGKVNTGFAARDQGRARRRHVQRGARDDVRDRLHPGAALQQQPLPHRRRHAGPLAGGRAACR